MMESARKRIPRMTRQSRETHSTTTAFLCLCL